jgi:hypothetical protein
MPLLATAQMALGAQLRGHDPLNYDAEMLSRGRWLLKRLVYIMNSAKRDSKSALHGRLSNVGDNLLHRPEPASNANNGHPD